MTPAITQLQGDEDRGVHRRQVRRAGPAGGTADIAPPPRRGGTAPVTPSGPNTAFAISAMPATVPPSEAASIGSTITFWFGAEASACRTRVYFSAIR